MKIDEGTAALILRQVPRFGDEMQDILRETTLDPDGPDYAALRRAIGDVLAHAADLLLHPAIMQHPELNPFRR